jgi:hypothetical protein
MTTPAIRDEHFELYFVEVYDTGYKSWVPVAFKTTLFAAKREAAGWYKPRINRRRCVLVNADASPA